MNKLFISKKHLLILLLILLLAGFLRIYKLGNQSFIADEYIGINVSYGLHQTGQWKYWDFNSETITDRDYTRGQVYYWQVAQLFKFFEPTEQNSRLVSVMWGLLGVATIFFVTFWITKNIYIALMSAFLLSMSVSALMFDRKLRMYSMFAPVYFLFSYIIFQFLESKKYLTVPKILVNLSRKTGLNLFYLPLMLLLGVLALLTHLLTVNIVSTIIAYLVIMAIVAHKKKLAISKNKYFLYLGLLVVLIAGMSQTKTFGQAANFFELGKSTWSYLEKISLDYRHELLALTFFFFGCYYLIKKYGNVGVWTILSFLTPLLSAIFLWDRSAGHQYIYFTQPFKVVIMAAGIYFVAKIVSEKVFSRSKLSLELTLAYFILILINLPFFISSDSFYQNPRHWDYSNYREAYNYFLKKSDPDEAILMRKFMSFNVKGANREILEYGAGNKLTLEKLEEIQKKHDGLWLINTDGEFNIKSDAKKHIKNEFSLIKTKYTNDKVQIWHWEKEKLNND
ncbi:MAG: hypothetical protein U9O20_02160 [Patescibacteria group bacterium]|nr:hypothetical protein [Patescibacteria group bacterium]